MSGTGLGAGGQSSWRRTSVYGQDPFQDSGDDFEEDDYAEGGWRVVRGLARLLKEDAICVLKGRRVVLYFNQRGEEGEEYLWVVMVDLVPYEVGNLVRAWG